MRGEERSDEQRVVSYSDGRYVEGAKRRAEGFLKEFSVASIQSSALPSAQPSVLRSIRRSNPRSAPPHLAVAAGTGQIKTHLVGGERHRVHGGRGGRGSLVVVDLRPVTGRGFTVDHCGAVKTAGSKQSSKLGMRPCNLPDGTLVTRNCTRVLICRTNLIDFNSTIR